VKKDNQGGKAYNAMNGLEKLEMEETFKEEKLGGNQ